MNAPDHTNEPERLWNAVETARYLGMSKSWVYRHTSSGEIPAAKFGHVFRYHPARVREYAEQMQARTSSPNVVSLADRRKDKR